jgi:transposase-like protein
VATLVRTVFAQPDAASTWAQHARIVDQLAQRFPAAAELLADAAGDLLAFTAFPKEHWRQIWSNNPQERLNKELRRRTDVIGIFPNREAVLRLSGRCWPSNTTSGGGPPLHERRIAGQDPHPGHRRRIPTRGGEGADRGRLSPAIRMTRTSSYTT